MLLDHFIKVSAVNYNLAIDIMIMRNNASNGSFPINLGLVSGNINLPSCEVMLWNTKHVHCSGPNIFLISFKPNLP